MAGGTKAALLAAARRCLVEGGTAAATSRNLAEAAGANLGAITYHWNSKDELLAEALVESVRELLEPALAALDTDQPATARLLDAVDRLRATLRDHRPLVGAYVEAIAAARVDEGLASRLRQLRSDVTARVAADTAASRASGAVPDWVDPTTMAALFMAIADGIAVAIAVGDEDVDGVIGHLLLLMTAAAPRR